MIPLTIILLVLAIYDTWYTYKLLDRGFKEGNPVMAKLIKSKSRQTVYGATIVFWLAISVWTWYTLDTVYYYVGMGVAIMANGLAILYNYNIARRRK